MAKTMQLVFLEARLPLTKTFVARDGQIVATPYPHVTAVTSHHHEFTDLAQMHRLLIEHAEQDHCLFNGRLTHPLKAESRAGKSVKADRDWIVFDFDKVQGTSPEDVIKRYLPAVCQNVSYIAQLSASMFRPDVKSWSGHIFMLLKEPASEQKVKQWFEHLNFTQPSLEQSLSLSDSMQALHWPLDRTVAHNSKLIYIASPKCHGFAPAISEHIKLVKKRVSHLSIPSFTPIDTHDIRRKINELRKAVGEDEIAYDVVPFEGHEVLRNSGICDVHGMRTSGDHFVRFNLNGGDSYAYYIDLRNPELIRNFKGEPFLRTEDANPDLWKALRKVAPAAVTKQPLDDGAEVLAFYATNKASTIKIGLYTPTNRKLTLNTANETAARAWLIEYGLVQKGFLPHYDLIFDPQSDVQFIPGSTVINTFRPTPYMRKPTSKIPSTAKEVPTVINRVLRSAMGNPTEDIYAHFLNWLAYIWQFRKKTETAWVFSGEEGTGKGAFVKFVLNPLFGPEHVRTMQYGALKAEFNGYLENALFVVFEEADMRATENQYDTEAKIRHYITDSPIEIRAMQREHQSTPNYSNFLFFSNKRTSVNVAKGDRRFNICEWQPKKLNPTPNEILILSRGEELETFADVLSRWPVDEVKVRTLIQTQTARDVHEATSTINVLIAEAIMDGNLQFFFDNMPSDMDAAHAFNNKPNPLPAYRTAMQSYLVAAQQGEVVYLKDTDLYVLFRTLIPEDRYFQDGKMWRTKHYKQIGLKHDQQHRLPGTTKKVYGQAVQWKMPENTEMLPEEMPKNDGKIVSMNRKAKGK